MRESQELVNHHPRKYVWWMECDYCHTTRSDPKWDCSDLPLKDFRALGWECGSQKDKCPACIEKEKPPVLNKEEWVEQVARAFVRQMPDQYPDSFATFMAKDRADSGGYADYVAGKFPEGTLWAPNAVI